MTLPFNERLNIGETVERSTAKYIIEHLGADVEKIGSLETDEIQKPLTCRWIDGIHRRLVSADLNGCKDGLCYGTQVKLKNSIIHADSLTGKQCFYFDVWEHTRLSKLNTNRPCVLVIYCAELPTITAQHPELRSFKTPYILVDMKTLEPNQTLLHRTKVEGKDTFVLPLNLFKPLTEFFERKLYEPANNNTIPTTPAA